MCLCFDEIYEYGFWKLQQQQEMAIASNARGMMMRDHDGQFGYRVQPIQPNLQEKIMSLVID